MSLFWTVNTFMPPVSLQLVTAVWQGGYNFFCQDIHSGGEADNRVKHVHHTFKRDSFVASLHAGSHPALYKSNKVVISYLIAPETSNSIRQSCGAMLSVVLVWLPD